MNRYIAIIIAALTATEMQAFQLAPRLVVNITIDQLRTDYIEAFSPLYCQGGLRKLFAESIVYDAASYPYAPVDKASAIATLSTGTTPYYHGIVSSKWLDRSTLSPVFCIEDSKHYLSPAKLATSTIGDEMKISSNGTSIVYSVAADPETSILSAGHAADAAIWIDGKTGKWRTSTYYGATPPAWFKAYTSISTQSIKDKAATNDAVVDMSLQVIKSTAMGKDDVSDMINITLTAVKPDGTAVTDWKTEMESVYMKLDKTLEKLIEGIEKEIGKEHALFFITSTGYATETATNLEKYRIPTGTFYINRTANLLNMYLSAIYGQGMYAEACFRNQIYLNHKLIEQKRVSMSEVLNRSQEFIVLSSGISDVYTSERLLAGNNDILKIRNGFNPNLNGDITIEVTPGWRLLNEDTQETYTSRSGFVPFPIIIYGAGTKPQRVTTQVTVDRIAPTIAKSIRIRAPNACSAAPLF